MCEDEKLVRVVTTANEGYSIGLAALISSSLAHAERPDRLRFLVLDCGIGCGTKRKLRLLSSRFRSLVDFFPVDLSSLGNVDVTGHAGAPAYARLLSPNILSGYDGTVVYLDSDIIVKRDLSDLIAHRSSANVWAWAVPEVGTPFVSSPTAVFDWRDQQMSEQARYFNSGVLVFDLNTWRQHRIPERTLAYLRAHGTKVFWWDQGGLNVTLYGHWQALDQRWNQTHCIHYDRSRWLEAGFGGNTFELVKQDPYIVHFNGVIKPWHFGCPDPRVHSFYEYLSITPWARYRPKPTFFQSRWGSALRKFVRSIVPRDS